jgi:hypothetical protein
MVDPSIMRLRKRLNIPSGKPIISVDISDRTENNFADLTIVPVTTKAVASNIVALPINDTDQTTVK